MNAEEGRALYEQGLRQRATAGPLFQRASEWDVPEACWEMHQALMHGGCGLDQDTDAAEYFCLRGAELGERRCRATAHILYNYDNPMVYEATPQARATYEMYSHGLAPPVTEQDMQIMVAEAEQGDAWAAYFVALRYARHEQEFLAKKWLLQAGYKGLAPAQNVLCATPWKDEVLVVEAARQHHTQACMHVSASPGAAYVMHPADFATALTVCMRLGVLPGRHDWDDILLNNVFHLDVAHLEAVHYYVGAELSKTGGGINTVEMRCCNVHKAYRKRAAVATVVFWGCFRFRGATPGLSRDTATLIARMMADASKWLPFNLYFTPTGSGCSGQHTCDL